MINTLTCEPKIAKKTGQLMRLLAAILRKEYKKEPSVHIPQHRYIIKENGSPGVQKRAKVSAGQQSLVLLKDRTTKEKVSKLL